MKNRNQQLKEAINESATLLKNMPKFKPRKGKGLRLTSKGLIPYTFTESPQEQRRAYIHQRIAWALCGTLETPVEVFYEHLKELRKLFKDEKEILEALKIIGDGLNEYASKEKT